MPAPRKSRGHCPFVFRKGSLQKLQVAQTCAGQKLAPEFPSVQLRRARGSVLLLVFDVAPGKILGGDPLRRHEGVGGESGVRVDAGVNMISGR